VQTELKGSWKTGFHITEKDLRRILDLIAEKIRTHPDQVAAKEIKYRLANGAIIATDNIDDLFAEENVGTKRIVNIEYYARATGGLNAEIKFTDLVTEREEKNSIFYKLQGENRDPLFVLASELDERISYLRRVNMRPERSFEFFVLLVMLATSCVMIIFVLSFVGSLPNSNSAIEAYKAGKFAPDIQGLFQFMVQLEESRNDLRGDRIGPVLPLGSFFGVPVIGIVIWYFTRVCFYPFNFSWGEQAAVIERRDRRKNFILIGVGVALIVGIISSYVAGLIPKF
jgi:hypothetical protein